MVLAWSLKIEKEKSEGKVEEYTTSWLFSINFCCFFLKLSGCCRFTTRYSFLVAESGTFFSIDDKA